MELITQYNRTRYLDETKLRELLEELFGKNNFKMNVRLLPPCLLIATEIM